MGDEADNRASMMDALGSIGRSVNLLVGEIVRLQADVKAIRDDNKRVDKLVDRLIEMAMVTRGQIAEPFVPAKRASAEDDTDWTPRVDADEWPPKGHATMNYP